MKREFKVGDRVSFKKEKGTVISIQSGNSLYPLTIQFSNRTDTFTQNGFLWHEKKWGSRLKHLKKVKKTKIKLSSTTENEWPWTQEFWPWTKEFFVPTDVLHWSSDSKRDENLINAVNFLLECERRRRK